MELIVRTKASEAAVRIRFIDIGVGIDEERLTKIFALGFTTKESGHGIGLHGSALVAKELGGSHTVHCEGAGFGATFTLELPYDAPETDK